MFVLPAVQITCVAMQGIQNVVFVGKKAVMLLTVWHLVEKAPLQWSQHSQSL